MKTVFPLACLFGALVATSQAATYVGTTTYTGYEDSSPFFAAFGSISQQDPDGGVGETTSVYDFRGLSAAVAPASGDSYFFLEDVQDGQLDVPGVTFTGPIARTADGINGSNAAGGNTDNVAEDTLRLSSFRTTANQSGVGQGYIRADFNASALGGELPTWVGIVFAERTTNSLITDLGNGRLIRAYDASDNLLEEAFLAAGSATNADGFLGVSTTTGISYVVIAGDNEYDHFQYGFDAIPEPSAAMLGVFGSVFLLRRRRA